MENQAQHILTQLFKIVILLFATALTCVLNYFVVGRIGTQAMTANWSPTTGIIEKIDYVRHDSDDGSTFRVEVQYKYQLDGHNYQGDQVSYSHFGTSDVAWSRNYVASHPPGSNVPVYFNPRSPEQAVLEKGVQSSDLAILLFVGPFNALALGGWLYVFGYTTGDNPSRRNLLAKLRAALMGFVSGIGCLTFPSVFLVGFLYKMHPPMGVAQTLWGGILLTSLWFAWSSFRDRRTEIPGAEKMMRRADPVRRARDDSR